MDGLRDDISSAIEQEREQVSDNNQTDQVEEGSRPSVRDSIKAAFDEHRDDDVSEVGAQSQQTLDKATKEDLDKLPDWAKGKFGNGLSASAAKAITDWDADFQQHRARLTNYQEIERVIEPRKEFFAKNNVTPAQGVDRLLQWMDHLTHPNEDVRASAIIQLGKNYGVDVMHPDFWKPEQPRQTYRQTAQANPVLMAKWDNQLAEVRKNYRDYDLYWPLAQRMLFSTEFHTKDKDKFFGFDVIGALDAAKSIIESRKANKRRQDAQKAIEASRAAKPKPRPKMPVDTSVRRFLEDAVAAQKG